MTSAVNISLRLRHLIEYTSSHEQKQAYAYCNRICDKLFHFSIAGIGFDRWSLVQARRAHGEAYHIVSIGARNHLLYYNYAVFPCPVMGHMDSELVKGLTSFLSHEGEKWLPPSKKLKEKEKKLMRLQGFIDAAKRGDHSKFAHKIGKKKK